MFSRPELLIYSPEITIPRSSYYTGPPGMNSAFGTDPTGMIGVHYPREIVRIERDYTSGELPQYVLRCLHFVDTGFECVTLRFHPTFPLELEGRVSIC